MRNQLFVFTLLFSMTLTAQELQLSWKKDFDEATEFAKAENKPILIYFTKTDCEDCQQFYKDFFKQEAFNNLSNKFILLMLDGSNNNIKTNDISILKKRRLLMHYNKSDTFPAVLAVDKDRRELGEVFTSKGTAEISNYWSFLQTIN